MLFNLNMDENSKPLTNNIRSSNTKLRVLNLMNNKLHYLTSINPNLMCAH